MDANQQPQLYISKTSTKNSLNASNRSSGRWVNAFFGITCLSSLLLSAYAINNLYAYKLRVQMLESSVAGFQSQLVDLNLAFAEAMGRGALQFQPNQAREKRSIEDVDQPSNSPFGSRRPIRRRRTTTVSPTVAVTPNNGTRGYLSNTAERTSSLVVGSEEFTPRGVAPRHPGQSYKGTFTRWGKVSCPYSTTAVYAGYAASADPGYNMGGASELECLPMQPSWQGNSVTNTQTNVKLFTAKFSLGPHSGIFQNSANNAAVTCSVCMTTKALTISIPGRSSCPYGWSKEYSGYLMSSTAVRRPAMLTAKNYCVDNDPDYYTNFNDNRGLKLTFVQAGNCYQGRYPCQQYRENNRIACTVCSKS